MRRITNALNPAFHLATARLRTQRDLSVNLGSGGKGRPGWVNVELHPHHRDTTLALDIRRQLPFADGSIARILAEHVVEHVDFRHDVPKMVRDWYRVLRPGGVVRVIVPDAERFLRAYASGEPTEWEGLGWGVLPHDIHTRMHVLNHIFHQEGEHLFGYDFETLKWVLRQAGFQEVVKMSFGKSLDPALAIDQENHRPYSLYVEARK